MCQQCRLDASYDGVCNEPRNPKLQDLLALHNVVGEDRERIFYAGVASIAEFTVYKMLEFIETYNQFDTEDNASDHPRLELVYSATTAGGIKQVTLSEFVSDYLPGPCVGRLGKLFKDIARDKSICEMLKSAIDATVSNPNSRFENED